MNVTEEVAAIINSSFMMATEKHYEYVTPELVLLAMCSDDNFSLAFRNCGGDIETLTSDLKGYLDEYVEKVSDVEPEMSAGMQIAFAMAQNQAVNSSKTVVELSHLVHAFFNLKESFAVYYMNQQGVDEVSLIEELLDTYEESDESMLNDVHTEEKREDETVTEYAPCINDMLENVNPLIGREAELERTIQILCRKDKNNPLHVGEPGVGKTAITYGLARLLNEGNVPDPLKGARIYSLDLGSLLAGTKYRGDFEKRLKKILSKIEKEDNPIIYVDEIHNLLGAGATGEGSFDAANILKPYLAAGKIRFIGATTFEEYKKHFEKSKSLVRRFQNVEIKEPGIDEAIKILEGLKKKYEKFHGVTYGKGVLEYAVRMSQRYINERFLPDKAIDLIDEAGAYRKIHPLQQKKQTVGKDLINEVLTKICRVPVEAAKTDDLAGLATLEKRMLSQVYGQDEAIKQVVNAVKFSKAGMIEETKPLASLLFVGPTGVGKTEIARTLAKELGVSLVRFDMSEYEEKHSVAKLVGAPAGYVGYEEGGLLTEEIRKNPNSVLLLDEIEKAHPDVFNILLQVMDYATLTDNQGRKADFRNVIIIMTSNAGASRLGKSGIGFLAQDGTKDTLMEEVKRVFQPEFRNRLSQIVVFNSMDETMAGLIAEKKLSELSSMLSVKQVELSFTTLAVQLLKKKGISKEYGAREIDRVIRNDVKTLLVDEILFGRLKKGGKCELDVKGEKFTVRFIAQHRMKKQIKSDVN
ncbi:ATP-dependent Clp protease ATP-binding subunit ClpA [Oribacterium sp. C9]|uniref:AAA family ATPase n=1 Tax=Oribacterium sp. C9 TaxID=1943579 RepID=UPI00098E9D21|nr:AAA family ATPase [Oribacterium sp. C9]OON84810.1 ATP-dependent Clp protease ATP-binding subunit ClpA [Oribacterium sp. C9]